MNNRNGNFSSGKSYGAKTFSKKRFGFAVKRKSSAHSNSVAWGEDTLTKEKGKPNKEKFFSKEERSGRVDLSRKFGNSNYSNSDKPVLIKDSEGRSEENRSRGHRNRGFEFSDNKRFSRNSGFRKPMQKSKRVFGSRISMDQLVNKVQDDTHIKPVEHKITHNFADFDVDEKIKNNISKKGYVTPSPIQDQAIPVGLAGNDVIGVANTGTGKTAAFLIPLLNKMLKDRTEKAIILAPTRELAFQINDELFSFSKGLELGSVLCIGGSDIQKQIRLLKKPNNFVIGTPGRILDLINRKVLKLDNFRNVVLDEADLMVDMGFINDIKSILGKLPEERQSFFFTATLERKVEDLIQQFLRNPVKISVQVRKTAANVDQDIVKVPKDSKAKMAVLVEYLSKPDFHKVLVFGRTKHGVEKIALSLQNLGIKVDSIHGNKSQNYRLKALQRFKKGEVDVLVATDIAARGLDISGVSHVINYDPPANYDDYIHRIGRTGRADNKGNALTFVS